MPQSFKDTDTAADIFLHHHLYVIHVTGCLDYSMKYDAEDYFSVQLRLFYKYFFLKNQLGTMTAAHVSVWDFILTASGQ